MHLVQRMLICPAIISLKSHDMCGEPIPDTKFSQGLESRICSTHGCLVIVNEAMITIADYIEASLLIDDFLSAVDDMIIVTAGTQESNTVSCCRIDVGPIMYLFMASMRYDHECLQCDMRCRSKTRR